MSTLLMVRVPPAWAQALRTNPLREGYFEVRTIGQSPGDDIRDWVDDTHQLEYSWQTFKLHKIVAKACRVSHAIIAQPLHWYSEAAAGALRSEGVRVFWAEAHYDRVILDELGAPYTPDNEILRHEGDAPVYALPAYTHRTRYPQPAHTNTSAMYLWYGPAHNTVVIFGQVPGDMALQTTKGMTYREWLDAIVTENPGARFLFNHHPHAQTSLKAYPNLTVVNESVFSLFRAYPRAAAFSSSVIAEGMTYGVKFATGGHHSMSGFTLDIPNRRAARDLLGQLDAMMVDSLGLARRRSFIEHHYTYLLDKPAAIDRLITPPTATWKFYQDRIVKHGKD